MWVQVPPFALLLLSLAIVVVPTQSCQTRCERLQGEAIYHLKNVTALLARSAGKAEQAAAELSRYMKRDGDRIAAFKADRDELLHSLPEDARQRYLRNEQERIGPYCSRLREVLAGFTNRDVVIQKVLEMQARGLPECVPGHWFSWGRLDRAIH